MSRDVQNMLGGSLLVLTGLSWSSYAVSQYSLGTLSRMGSGLFPAALGALLSLFGLLIAVTAFRQGGHRPEIRVRTPIFVLLSVVSFALLIQPLGMFPAIVAVVVISAFAESSPSAKSTVAICIGLCALCWLVFHFALSLTIPLVNWPW